MSDWYVSSVMYAATAAFQTTHAYVVGDFIKPTAPAVTTSYVFRCTTAGTTAGSEPSWISVNNATTTSGTAVFTHVTGQSTYGWSAASNFQTINSARLAAGDRVFISSDHSESLSSINIANISATYTLTQFLSVNRAGSVPPVAADLQAGALMTCSSATNFWNVAPLYFYGLTFAYTGSSSIQFFFGTNGFKALYFDTCQLYLNNASATRINNGNPVHLVLTDSTVKFDDATQSINTQQGTFYIDWTGGGVVGTAPTVLFQPPSGLNAMAATLRGVDLSNVTGTLVRNASTGNNPGYKILFDSCKIASGVTRYSITNCVNSMDLVELVNCYDGTNFLNESYQPFGTLTTDFSVTLSSGGAADNVGTYSHKLVSNTNINKFVDTLTSFWMDCNYTTTGASKVATVEIISSTTLNNDEIALYLEYQGTSGSSIASFADNAVATVLTTPAAVTSSTATWNNPPATPVTQKLQITFTPQVAGRVRAQVRLGKASTTVWVNPRVNIS